MSLLDQQRLQGLLGAGLGQGLAQQPDPFQGMSLAQAQLDISRQRFGLLPHLIGNGEEIGFSNKTPKKKTIREELQTETDNWLKDTI